VSYAVIKASDDKFDTTDFHVHGLWTDETDFHWCCSTTLLLAKLSYEERLIKMDLPSLTYRRRRGVLLKFINIYMEYIMQ